MDARQNKFRARSAWLGATLPSPYQPGVNIRLDTARVVAGRNMTCAHRKRDDSDAGGTPESVRPGEAGGISPPRALKKKFPLKGFPSKGGEEAGDT
jgi:hypothetical protein